MDALVMLSTGTLVVNAFAVLIWTTRIAWHRMHGEHVNWW